MKLTTMTNVSLDGVAQGLGGSQEDRRGGFDRGGWAMPLFDAEVESVLGEVYQRADAFLFGRWTFEVFAGSWGADETMMSSPIGRALNTRPKYVVSSTLSDPQWADTTVLRGDAVAAVRELKDSSAGELQVHGSLSVVRRLLVEDMVDEVTLFTYPVIVGQGARLFPAAGTDTALELVTSRTTANGVTVTAYRPAGRPSYAS